MKKLMLITCILVLAACHDKYQYDHSTLVTPPASPAPPVAPAPGLSCVLYDLNLIQPSVMPTFNPADSQALLGTVSAGPAVSTFDMTGAVNYPTLAAILAQSGSVLTQWVALDCKGNLDVATAATYTFKLNSDDGSLLFIDGLKVVNNDGNHGALLKSGSVNLSEGSHTVELQYYEGNGPAVLQLFSNIAVEFTH